MSERCRGGQHAAEAGVRWRRRNLAEGDAVLGGDGLLRGGIAAVALRTLRGEARAPW